MTTLEKQIRDRESWDSAESHRGSCPYCGTSSGQGLVKAKCSVCGMNIAEDHSPNIICVTPGEGVVHFCSLVCMFNYEHMEEGDSDG